MARRTLTIVGIVVAMLFGGAVTWLKAGPRKERFGVDVPRPGSKSKAKGRKSKSKPRAKAASRAPSTLPVERRPSPPEGAPSVVLVFGCTVRRDQIGAYGGRSGVTPFIDGLAESGVRFDDALSVSSWTRASAVGVITGRHPLSFNLPEPGPRQSERVLTHSAVTLAERLANAGWITSGVTANPNLNSNYGMAQGMDRYSDSSAKAFRRGRASGRDVVDQAMQFIDQRPEDQLDRPIYLRLMMIDAHHPRTPAAELVQANLDAGVSPLLAEYQASLTELDRALDQLDRGLRSRGFDPSNTVFVFVADHGEGLDLPPHHGPGHGKKMYPSTVSIPWLIRGPGVPEGQVVSGLASGVDVKPTVLGLLNMSNEAGSAGSDLSAWVTGERAGVLPRDRAYAASMFHVANVGSIWTRDTQCQAWFPGDKDKLVEGCFDRATDPGFSDPIADPAGLQKELQNWRARQMALGKRFDVDEAEVGDEQQSQLELLGYLDED